MANPIYFDQNGLRNHRAWLAENVTFAQRAAKEERQKVASGQACFQGVHVHVPFEKFHTW